MPARAPRLVKQALALARAWLSLLLAPRMSGHSFRRRALPRGGCQVYSLWPRVSTVHKLTCAVVCAVLQDAEHAAVVLGEHAMSSVHGGEQRLLDGGRCRRRLVDNKPYDAAAAPPQHALWYRNFSTALLILMQARPSARGGSSIIADGRVREQDGTDDIYMSLSRLPE